MRWVLLAISLFGCSPQKEPVCDQLRPMELDAAVECTGQVRTFAANGVVTSEQWVEQDAAGRPLRTTTYTNSDDVPDAIEVRAYRPDGAITRIATDSDGDGAAERVEYREYDSAGHLAMIWTENLDVCVEEGSSSYAYSDDGDIEEVQHYGATGAQREVFTYDAEGQLVRAERFEEPGDRLVFRVDYEWADGHKRWADVDEDGDGVTDVVTFYVWSGDRLTKVWTDRGDDGDWDEVVTYDYDVEGQLVGTFIDHGADGDFEWIERRTWSDGRLVALAIDKQGDGVIDERWGFGWRDDGRPLWESVDYDDDGLADRQRGWTWSCADE